ncbi:MAG: LPS export ABC transporter permease LptG [Gammaproteobacteria bacterium]|nr:LPS export ABC transporter permease LptG [Gammaproteobacteria bacterium]
MITTLDRYIGRSILMTSLLVLLTLLSLAGVFSFIAELEDVGKGSYSALLAAQYVLLTLPGKAYLLFAPAVLLGALLGLGALASNSELTVMRAAGVSVGRIIRAVLLTGVGLMLFIAILGETLLPKSEQIAEELRLTALEQRLSVKGNSGLWVRSGQRYVNISTVMPDFTLLDVTVLLYQDHQLKSSIGAARAKQQGNDWLLEDINITTFEPESVEKRFVESEVWQNLVGNDTNEPVPTLVSADVLKSLSISPESLSARNLYDQVNYLRANQLDSKSTELALWVKVLSPFATMVMLMLSLPFVFGSQRSGGAGQKIFIGILLGISYVLLNKLLTQLALANGLAPFISALIPLLCFLAIAVIGIQRVV